MDTRLFLYLVKNGLSGIDTLCFDFSYHIAPMRMDVLLFGHLGIKLNKDIFHVYELLAKSRRNNLGKIMRVLQNIQGIKKLYFNGSILNFLTEIQTILKNNVRTIREIRGVPSELFYEPTEGLCLYPREWKIILRSMNYHTHEHKISVLTKNMCFWAPDLNLQMILHETQEFTVTLTATTSISATMSLSSISTTMSENKPTFPFSNQANVTINKNFNGITSMASTSALHFGATTVLHQSKSKTLQKTLQKQNQPERKNLENEPEYSKKHVPFTSTKALEFHIKAYTSSTIKKNLKCRWEGCDRTMVFGGEFMLNMHMRRRHILEKLHFYEIQKIDEHNNTSFP